MKKIFLLNTLNLFLGVLLISCEKKIIDESLSVKDGRFVVTFSVNQENSINLAKQASIGANTSFMLPEAKLGSFNALVEPLKEVISPIKIINNQSISNEDTKAIKATSNLEENVSVWFKIRLKDNDPSNDNIWIYDNSISNQTGNGLVAEVLSGVEYEWFAYSFNNTDPIISDVMNSNGVIPSSNLIGKDFLFQKGNVVPQVGNNYLGIILDRKTIGIEVKVDTQGLFGTITNNTNLDLMVLEPSELISAQAATTGNSAVNTISSFKSYDFNIYTANYEGVGDDYAPTINAGNMVEEVGYNNSIKTATFYLPRLASGFGFSPTDALYVRMNPLAISLATTFTGAENDDRYFPKNPADYLWSYDPTAPNDAIRQYDEAPVIQISNNTLPDFSIGTKYKVTITAIESGIMVGNVEWARSDLFYFQELDADEPGEIPSSYRFHPHATDYDWDATNVQINGTFESIIQNRYWPYLSLTPTGVTSNTITNDPCLKVLPENSWRIASEANYQELYDYYTEGMTVLSGFTPTRVSIPRIPVITKFGSTANTPVRGNRIKFMFGNRPSDADPTFSFYQLFTPKYYDNTANYVNQEPVFLSGGYVNTDFPTTIVAASNPVESDLRQSLYWMRGANGSAKVWRQIGRLGIQGGLGYQGAFTYFGDTDNNLTDGVYFQAGLPVINNETGIGQTYNVNKTLMFIRCVRNK